MADEFSALQNIIIYLIQYHSYYYTSLKLNAAIIQEQSPFKGSIYYTKAPSMWLTFNTSIELKNKYS